MPTFTIRCPHPWVEHGTISIHLEAPDLQTCRDLAFQLLTSYDILGTYVPGDSIGGNLYLFIYKIGITTAMSTISAGSIHEAEACMAELALEGIVHSQVQG